MPSIISCTLGSLFQGGRDPPESTEFYATVVAGCSRVPRDDTKVSTRRAGRVGWARSIALSTLDEVNLNTSNKCQTQQSTYLQFHTTLGIHHRPHHKCTSKGGFLPRAGAYGFLNIAKRLQHTNTKL